MRLCDNCNNDFVKGKSTYCKKCHSEYMKNWYKNRDLNIDDIIKRKKYRMISSAKKRAAKLNLNFNIDISDIKIPENCPALGIKISLNNKKIDNDSPTLDKIIPDLGYVKGNVIVISCKANRIKSDATSQEIRKVSDWLKTLTTD